MKTKTLTKNLLIAIILATVCIASFALSVMHFNASAETMYLVNYVDQAGRLIKTETTSLGNLSGADKEGYTANYSVVHSTITALPFQKINLKEPILYNHANGGYSLVGGNKDFLDWYDINQPKESWEAQIFYEKLIKEWGYNQIYIYYENEYYLNICVKLDNSLSPNPVIRIKLGENIYELRGSSGEMSEYGAQLNIHTAD